MGLTEAGIVAAKIEDWPTFIDPGCFNLSDKDCVIASRVGVDDATLDESQCTIDQRRAAVAAAALYTVEPVGLFGGKPTGHMFLVLREEIYGKETSFGEVLVNGSALIDANEHQRRLQ